MSMLQRGALPLLHVLLSKRELQHCCAAGPTTATMPTSPVLLVHGKLHWQHHALQLYQVLGHTAHRPHRAPFVKF